MTDTTTAPPTPPPDYVTVSTTWLLAGLAAVGPAVGRNRDFPAFMNYLVHPDHAAGALRILATDRYRLHLVTLPMEPGACRPFLLDRDAAGSLSALAPPTRARDTVRIAAAAGRATFTTAAATVEAGDVDGAAGYPRIWSLLGTHLVEPDTAADADVQVSGSFMLDALRSAGRVARLAKGARRTVRVTARGSRRSTTVMVDGGSDPDALPMFVGAVMPVTGPPEVGFRALEDALAAATVGKVTA